MPIKKSFLFQFNIVFIFYFHLLLRFKIYFEKRSIFVFDFVSSKICYMSSNLSNVNNFNFYIKKSKYHSQYIHYNIKKRTNETSIKPKNNHHTENSHSST